MNLLRVCFICFIAIFKCYNHFYIAILYLYVTCNLLLKYYMHKLRYHKCGKSSIKTTTTTKTNNSHTHSLLHSTDEETSPCTEELIVARVKIWYAIAHRLLNKYIKLLSRYNKQFNVYFKKCLIVIKLDGTNI